ncbi:MAG: hypothetical protein U0K52_05090 [Clostridia bacterium]|nr:hypothetical protein [Clostridia bacterium]
MDNFQKNLQILIGKKEINQAIKCIINTISRNIIEKQKIQQKNKAGSKAQKEAL